MIMQPVLGTFVETDPGTDESGLEATLHLA
jgi:hypothetical protein